MPPTRLIIVCCHGIWLGGPSAGHDESEWLIADFQKGETSTFIEHIKSGVECLTTDPTSALVFSGGPTRAETSLSEAQSYANLAGANTHWNHPINHSHILLEERALDSYQNILFSLTLFYKTYSTWPSRITIISHAFKRPRLVDGHCVAIGFPLEKVSFLGIDPESMRSGENKAAIEGVKVAVGDWDDDPHGRDGKLRGKRERRNVYDIWQGVFEKGFAGAEGSRLVTTGYGEQETLEDDAPRPWI